MAVFTCTWLTVSVDWYTHSYAFVFFLLLYSCAYLLHCSSFLWLSLNYHSLVQVGITLMQSQTLSMSLTFSHYCILLYFMLSTNHWSQTDLKSVLICFSIIQPSGTNCHLHCVYHLMLHWAPRFTTCAGGISSWHVFVHFGFFSYFII